jgi:hypothetical protein
MMTGAQEPPSCCRVVRSVVVVSTPVFGFV